MKERPWLRGPANGSWKGGRRVASNGYITVRVDGGWKYEHRYVMELHLGRPLAKQEHVHHIDGDKTNNCIENLLVVNGISEHAVLHREKQMNRQLPTEENFKVVCKCGCGTELDRYDSLGRPRKYVRGHNPTRSKLYVFKVCLERGKEFAASRKHPKRQ